MRGVIVRLSLACYIIMTYSQQCRQVLTTVCDNDVIKSNMQKGDKGDVGGSGNYRSSRAKEYPGAKGEAGGFGEKGMQGESCTLGSLGTDIVTRLASKLISDPRLIILIIVIFPASIKNSAIKLMC